MSSSNRPVPEHLQARHQLARKAMAGKGLTAFLVTSPADLAYLTDFSGEDSLALLTDRELLLLTDFRFEEQAEIECPWLPVFIRKETMAKVLPGLLAERGLRKIAVDPGSITYGQVLAMTATSQESKAGVTLEVLPCAGLITDLRQIKDEVEIGLIQTAVNTAEAALQATLKQLKLGMTEGELAGILQLEIRKLGGQDVAFPVIVASGPAASLPHYRAANVPIRNDTVLLIDFGVRQNGYLSDLTRTYLIGQVPEQLVSAYQLVLDAQKTAIAGIGPGMTCSRADALARDVIEAGGYGPQFGHSLGHGIGRDIHEQPGLRKMADEQTLKRGMVVTIEPGIYLPGLGGIRIEDDVVITDNGCKVMSSLPKELKDCRIRFS
jgi:Xaa-Pro aminopeptidase